MAKREVDLGGGLKAQIDAQGGASHVALLGAVTEAASFTPLTQLGTPVRIDLAGVERINSIGVRNWIHFVKQCESSGIDLSFERCSPAIVQQISMISNFMGARSRVTSLFAPYLCGSCNAEHLELVSVTPGHPVAVQHALSCPKCQAPMMLDELEAMYGALPLH